MNKNYLRITLIISLLIITGISMFGCGSLAQYWCEHDITPATCEAPQTCRKCGATGGKALGHTWGGTCGRAQSCTRCGELSGKTISHKWRNATCENPSTCTQCGATQGTELGHKYSYSDVKTPTCTENGVRRYTCSTCHNSYDEAISSPGHNISNNTCLNCGQNFYTGSISSNLRASEITVDWTGRSNLHHDVLDLNQYYDINNLIQQGYTKIEVTVSMDIILKLSIAGVGDVTDSQHVFLYPTEKCPSGTLTECLYDTTYPYIYTEVFYHQTILKYKPYSFTTVIDLNRLPEGKIYIRYDVGMSGTWKNKNLNVSVTPIY